ncbi:ankyrin repeat domain-containing protein 61-like isoform X2 [Mugil cephalus]|uniref:ankyrin repeat domain-containing protein 61-like isoform X2 n=1 Tax=Mugil cephalus TaxID=48193 RepID=UPI001FB77B6B|nr:ankyrin repeat domain-containing protein 61-like isoform X2 [Mugil cephalus]
MDTKGNHFKVCKNEFYSAIIDEDLGRLTDLLKKYWSNFVSEIQGGPSGESPWKGVATLPLHLAVSYRRLKSVQSLLSAGMDTEMRDRFGQTPLHLLISCWQSIPPSLADPQSKFHTVMIGMRRQAEACLRLLCEHGANVNAEEGKSQQTPLHMSVRHNALSAIQILSSYGANVNAVSCSGMTALHMAAGVLRKDIIVSLIRQGADVNMRSQQSGNTPLHLAVGAVAMKTTRILEDDISCITELTERGAEPNIANAAGMTPLQEACSMGNAQLVDLLLRYGADINKLSHAGESCLFLFLNRRANLKNGSLLVKLLNLTSPLTIHNRSGHLPSTLTLPCFFKERDQLLKLTEQPKRLQDICKSHIYLRHVEGKAGELREVLPTRLYDFVLNHWENIYNISFVTDGEESV